MTVLCRKVSDSGMNSYNGKQVEINWSPDRGSGTPVYAQIVRYIADKIRCGDWVEGQKLPPQRKLAELFCVNRSTVSTAMDELMSYGIIESDHGGGTRVTGGSWSLRLAQPPDWNRYITGSPFHANKPTIQMINRMEFKEGYIRIGTGELAPELYPNALMEDILHRIPEKIQSLNYLGALGLPQLREELCRYLQQEKGIHALPENILITTGSLQALQLISICMLRPGSTVFTEAPTYLKSLQVFQSAGMQLRGLPMDEEGIRYQKIRPDETENAIIYTIPTFHNPTGCVMSQQRRQGLLSFCMENSLPMIEDDAYGSLWFDKKPPAPVKSLDAGGNVLYLGTLSKTIAPGLRIGWVVGPEAVIDRLGDVKMQTDYGSSSVSQLAAAELLSDPGYEAYLSDLRKRLMRRRDNALKAIRRHFEGLCEWNCPSGGFYIWLKFHNSLPIDTIFYEALDQGILLNPGNVYDYRENNAIRISYSYASEEELEKAIGILAEIIVRHIKK